MKDFPSLLIKETLFPALHSSDRFSSPASGYRSNTTGALGGAGTEGTAWASSPYASGNNNAGRLFFKSGEVNPLNNINRSYGFSVRCVQHLRLLFSKVKSER